MKKILLIAAVILLLAGHGLGGLSAYIYISSQQDCADAVERSVAMERTAVAAAGSADGTERDADYARSGAQMICENTRERRQNVILFAIGALAVFVLGGAVIIISRRV